MNDKIEPGEIIEIYSTPVSDGNYERIVAGTFRIKGPGYKIQWLLNVARNEGLAIQQIKRQEKNYGKK